MLLLLTVLLMAKFYLHELTLGQTNILLGTLLVAALLAVQIDHPLVAAGLIGAAAFVKPYALVLLPWLAFSYGAATIGVGLAVLGVGLLLPALVYGWSGNLQLLVGWYQTVTVIDRTESARRRQHLARRDVGEVAGTGQRSRRARHRVERRAARGRRGRLAQALVGRAFPTTSSSRC